MSRNPFEELERLFDRMESQFEGQSPIGGQSVPVNVVDEDEAFVVEAELPGYESDDLDLTYAEGRLSISADREERVETDFVRSERSTSVERTVRLPEPIDEEGIDADLGDDGILTVHLPKAAPDEAGKQIEIE